MLVLLMGWASLTVSFGRGCFYKPSFVTIFCATGARLLLYQVAVAPSAVREVADQAGIKTRSSLLLVRGGQCGVGLMRHSPVSV